MQPRVIFMGTPDFAVPSLKALVQQGFDISGVITQPDRPKGRGYQATVSAVKAAALELGLAVMQPENVNDAGFLARLSELRTDVMVVAAFGQILKTELLHLPLHGCLNVHASLLPKYRGASPIQWAIANGEVETGITVQKMALRVDSGDILVQRPVCIGPEETAAELTVRLAEMGGAALSQAIAQLLDPQGNHGQAQDESQATFAPRLSREDGRLDWSWPADKIYNRIRAFQPWPGTFTEAGDQGLKIIRVARAEALEQPAVPGTILASDPDRGWLVATGDASALRVLQVQSANTKIMSAHAFTCGYHRGIGFVLGTRREVHGG
jgi:methionyl-tRNA formyltransferase